MAQSIPQYCNDFLEYCEVEKGLSPMTSKNYRRFLDKFFLWLRKNDLETLAPQDLTEDHIWKYRVWLSRLPNATKKTSPGLASSTQIRYLIALRALLGFFHEKNIPSLPTEKIKLPKETHERKVKFLSLEDVEKILASPDTKHFAGVRDRAILETLFSTGLRVAELVSLDTKHLAGAMRKDDFEISISGKGGHLRTVYFSERALSWIKKFLALRGNDDEPALFIRMKGPESADKRLTTRGVEFIVQKYARES